MEIAKREIYTNGNIIGKSSKLKLTFGQLYFPYNKFDKDKQRNLSLNKEWKNIHTYIKFSFQMVY